MTTRELITEYQKAGAITLPITPEHTLATETLPWHHRDPFDRMLVAQALCENLTLVTQDAKIAGYAVARLW